MIRVVHPGSGSWFFDHPGSRGQKAPGSGSTTLNPCYDEGTMMINTPCVQEWEAHPDGVPGPEHLEIWSGLFIPDSVPGSRGQKTPDPDPQHCYKKISCNAEGTMMMNPRCSGVGSTSWRRARTGSRIRLFSIPDPHKRIKYFNPKKLFLSSRKYDPGCSSRIRFLIFLTIPDPGCRDQKGHWSRIRIRNTDSLSWWMTKRWWTPVCSGVGSTSWQRARTGSRIRLFSIPDPHQRIKYFKPKKKKF